MRDESADRELNLRGETVEEALVLLERFLTEAAAGGVGRIKVIHGKGMRSPNGFGVVREPAKMVRHFVVDGSKKTLLDVPLTAPNASDNRDDPKFSEWGVRMEWKKTFDRDDARHFKGIFANPNIVCKLRHKPTVDFLRAQFGVDD